MTLGTEAAFYPGHDWFTDDHAAAGLLQIRSAGKTVPRHFERTALVYPLRAGRPFAAFAWVGQVPGDFPRPVLGYLVRA